MILQEYLKSEGWKQLSLNVFRNNLYYITYFGSDVYGFEEYVIENMVYGRKSVVYRGRILTIAQFQVVMTFIKGDYQLTSKEIEILKAYGNEEEEHL